MAGLLQIVKTMAFVLGFIVIGAGALVGYTVWDEGPYTAVADADAAMERMKDVELAGAGMKYDALVKLLGEPERIAAKSELKGAGWARWYRGAVAGYRAGDGMYTLTIRDASRTGEQPFWDKTVFRGSLHGLRVGDPVPQADAAAKLRGEARGVEVNWEQENGRITSVRARNEKYYAAPAGR